MKIQPWTKRKTSSWLHGSSSLAGKQKFTKIIIQVVSVQCIRKVPKHSWRSFSELDIKAEIRRMKVDELPRHRANRAHAKALWREEILRDWKRPVWLGQEQQDGMRSEQWEVERWARDLTLQGLASYGVLSKRKLLKLSMLGNDRVM